MLIDMVQEATNVLVSREKIVMAVEHTLVFLDRAHEALGMTILGRLTHNGHTEMDLDVLQFLDRYRLGYRGVVRSLVGVMNLKSMLHQGSLQSGQGKRVVQVAADMRAANSLGVDIHQYRQIYVLIPPK
jgi:hypothetical protein